LAVALAGSVAGCADLSIESKKVDYKSASANRVPSLEVPPDLTSPARDDRFVVPDTGGKGSATYSAYSEERAQGVQRPSEVLPEMDKVRVERSGNQRWLVVGDAPDNLWGRIRSFWQELGFLIRVDLPEAGVMETDWAENRARIGDDFIRNWLGKIVDSLYSTAERDKFRTRLEPGATPGTTEIYISHRGMYEIYVSEGKDETRWQPRNVDPELEVEMLRRLMVYLGAEERQAQAELAETKSRPTEHVRLERHSDGADSLVVQESFDRAWRRVGLALDRVGFTVEDRDRSKGLYFVRYVDPESEIQNKESSGLFSRLAFWRSSAPNLQTRYRVYVKQEDDAQTSVRVLSAEGDGTDRSDTGKKILALLLEQLK
jgi:outer membrane protein assembly factor BamC